MFAAVAPVRPNVIHGNRLGLINRNRLESFRVVHLCLQAAPSHTKEYGEVRLMIRDDDTEIRIREKRTPPMGQRRKRKNRVRKEQKGC
ncbi:hypothetical protein CEXT_618621 [Caerostris extrusa]|uniref:Uncharacterized protein n=1 Tax=Caerostris extrusa TaxID=172846 RepID=A0AAV4Q003_CAEEX|nr:hypothetical protein CEXT_618621 [Caerostris extrusa]